LHPWNLSEALLSLPALASAARWRAEEWRQPLRLRCAASRLLKSFSRSNSRARSQREIVIQALVELIEHAAVALMKSTMSAGRLFVVDDHRELIDPGFLWRSLLYFCLPCDVGFFEGFLPSTSTCEQPAHPPFAQNLHDLQ